MKKYISILRGINVGGKNKIKIIDLQTVYTELGFTEIKTYIQSGNVIFLSEISDIKLLEENISKKINLSFGFDVTVIVIEKSEFEKIIENNPFDNENAETKNLHITFLHSFPLKSDIEKINNEVFQPDDFVISTKTIYLNIRNGYGNTKLSNSFFEKKLKVAATTRNLKTVRELFKLCL